MWPFKKKIKGFRFWKGIATILVDNSMESVEFEIHLEEPIEDPMFLEMQLQRDESFRVNGKRPIYIMVPRKDFWTITFRVDRSK